MLPATVSNARIFTYNWHAEFSKDAVELTLRDHAEAFLLDLRALREEVRSSFRSFSTGGTNKAPRRENHFVGLLYSLLLALEDLS